MLRDIIVGLLLLFLFSILSVPDTLAEAYRIGPEDVLDVKFWQDNSLDATVKVTQDGKISLDIIGEVEAVGLTTTELEREIVRQMSRYNKAISQAVVRVVDYGSQKVYISGQVLNPGKYTFERIPDLWTLINEAGGVSESGDLTRIVIIRGGEQAGEVEVVNVARMVAEGRISELPKVRAGETVEVSRTPAGLPARTIGDQPEAKNIFYVTGAVRNPGVMTLETNTDILDAIALVGGPADNADMKNVKVVSKDGYGTQLVRLDLTRYGERGIPGRYFLRPEDNIIVPVKSGGLLGMGSLADFLTLLGGVSTAVLIYTSLSGDGS